MKVGYTIAAQRDLFEIGSWIAQDNPTRAETFVSELEKACESLSDMPRAFPILSYRGGAQVRRKPYRNYLIFYRVRKDMVEILHVLHGARDYAPIVFPE
jgi:toxin ParE1/3/4